MRHRGWRRFSGFFGDDHDFGAFFAFVFSVYWMFAPATKGSASLLLSLVRSALFIIEIAYIIEGGLGGNRSATASKWRHKEAARPYDLRRKGASGHPVGALTLIMHGSP
jgi:hypothetical protein